MGYGDRTRLGFRGITRLVIFGASLGIFLSWLAVPAYVHKSRNTAVRLLNLSPEPEAGGFAQTVAEAEFAPKAPRLDRAPVAGLMPSLYERAGTSYSADSKLVTGNRSSGS